MEHCVCLWQRYAKNWKHLLKPHNTSRHISVWGIECRKLNKADFALQSTQENNRIRDIFRPDFCEPLQIEADVKSVVAVALKQNFIPIVDGRGYLSGMVTRQILIKYLADMALGE